MKIDIENSNGMVFLSIAGNLDNNQKGQFQETYLQLLKKNTRYFILDMSEMNFVDSSGLGALVGFLKKIRAVNGKLKLCGLVDSVKETFSLTCLDKIFDIHNNMDEAKKSLSA